MKNPWQKLLEQMMKPKDVSTEVTLPGAAKIKHPRLSGKVGSPPSPMDSQRKAMFAAMGRKGS